MAHTSYDPRDAIRQKVGTAVYNPTEKKTTYCMTVTDMLGKTHNVPMLLSENCRSGSVPEFPYIKMHRAKTTYKPHNIQGSVRFMTSWIDLKVYITDIYGITVADFKQQILNQLQNTIRTNQSITAGTFWMNIEDEADIEEDDGQQVVFIYVVTLKCQEHDAC